jgi:hypothetical protein
MRVRRKAEPGKNIGAYMTVEASFIIPLVLVVFCVMIYAAFFLYDRTAFYNDAYLLCMERACIKERDKGDSGEKASDLWEKKRYAERYLAVKEVRAQFSESEKAVAAVGTAAVYPAVFGGSTIMPKDIWEIGVRTQSLRSDPPHSIRSFRRIRYLLQTAAGQFGENP